MKTAPIMKTPTQADTHNASNIPFLLALKTPTFLS